MIDAENRDATAKENSDANTRTEGGGHSQAPAGRCKGRAHTQSPQSSSDGAVTSRDTLFDDTFVPAGAPHANYDVAPDGTHLLVLKAAEDPQVIVVHHWREALRAKMAGTPPR